MIGDRRQTPDLTVDGDDLLVQAKLPGLDVGHQRLVLVEALMIVGQGLIDRGLEQRVQFT